MNPDQRDRQISKRERIAIRIILLLLGIIAPWQFDHQFKELVESLKQELAP